MAKSNDAFTEAVNRLSRVLEAQTDVLAAIAQSQLDIGALSKEVRGMRVGLENMQKSAAKGIAASRENSERGRRAVEKIMAAHKAGTPIL